LTLSVSSKLGKLLVLRTIPRKIPRVLRTIRIKMISSTKFVVNTIKITSIPSRLSIPRSISHRLSRILSTAQFKIFPKAKTLISPISKIRVSKLGLPSVARNIPKIIPKFSKRSQLANVPQTRISIKPFSKISISELKYPMKEISNIPNEIVILLDEFSYLPMWFTMPVIFAASFALGAIVSFLI
jgi:hypothetical protein